MSEFKKGQLVAVKYGISWEPRIFHREDDEGMWCMNFLSHGISPCPSGCVKPAEEVWADIFIGWERRAREQDDRAVEMESELVQRLRRQVGWLAQRLANNMPPETDCSGCFGWFPDSPHREDGRCATCWEEASLKAVENIKDE